jgi:hypothetical protein
MDETSGIALELRTGIPSHQVEDKEGSFMYCFTYLSRKRMKTAGAFGGRIRQALTSGLFLMARWSRIRKGGVMEYWSNKNSPGQPKAKLITCPEIGRRSRL